MIHVQCGLDCAQSSQESSAAEQSEEPLQVLKMFAIAKALSNRLCGTLVGSGERPGHVFLVVLRSEKRMEMFMNALGRQYRRFV